MVGERKGQSFWVVPFSFLPGYDSVGQICLWYFKMNIQQLLAWYGSYHLPCPAETCGSPKPLKTRGHKLWICMLFAECCFELFRQQRNAIDSLYVGLLLGEFWTANQTQCLTVFPGFREDYFLVWTWYGFPSHPRPSEFSGIFSLHPLLFSTRRCEGGLRTPTLTYDAIARLLRLVPWQKCFFEEAFGHQNG